LDVTTGGFFGFGRVSFSDVVKNGAMLLEG
jgi:hypothetical protein